MASMNITASLEANMHCFRSFSVGPLRVHLSIRRAWFCRRHLRASSSLVVLIDFRVFSVLVDTARELSDLHILADIS